MLVEVSTWLAAQVLLSPRVLQFRAAVLNARQQPACYCGLLTSYAFVTGCPACAAAVSRCRW
jgi:hypothetical protein